LVTTGAPIYLVSACSSGEEFVAAFRRYADRNGVMFVPIADPLPSGKKARFALTLKDGGVMVEGEAEVVSSARTPSVLYGRVGMTIKFLVPDEPSKTTLGELEKARLALKPTPPTIAPRPADVPAEPRPKPPPPTGRIDYVNALAECVAIGAGIPAPGDTGEVPPRNANQKFVVPALPSMPPGRSRPVSVVPPTPTTKPASPAPSRPNPPSNPPPVPPPRNPTPSAPLPISRSPRMATPFAPMPIVQQPAPPIVAPVKPPTPEVELSEPTDLTGIPQVQEDLEAYPQGDSTAPHGGGSAPVMIVAPTPKEASAKTGRETRKTVMGIAVVPSGVMVLPAAPALRTPTADETRDTSAMTAITTPGPITVRGDAIDEIDPLSSTLPLQALLRPSVVQATVEEPTPSGDWTMTPGVNGPTIIPTPRDNVGRASTVPAPVPAARPTGDWLIALDPSQPDGWSEPSKVEKRPAGDLPPGPPVSVVSSARPLDSNRRLTTEPSIVDSDVDKVQVDPTLIGPLVAMPSADDEAADPALPPPPSTAYPVVGEDGLMPIPASMSPMPQVYEAPPMPGAMAHHIPGSIQNVFTPPVGLPQLASASGANPVFDPPAGAFVPQRMVTDAGSGFFRESGDLQSYASGATPIAEPARSKRMIVIIASAVGVALLAIILLLALGGGSDKKPGVTPNTADKADKAAPRDKQNVVVPPSSTTDAGTETAVVDAANAGEVTPDPVVTPESSVDCKVSVSSVPSGAEIVIDKNVVGTTPTSLTLPCGAEAKLVVRKARFASQTRTVTPKVGHKPIKVALAKVTFSVKVSSTPPGASITVSGKPMGFTPTTVKLPAFEASTLKIAKDGFTADMQKITPKQNNQTVHTTLKRVTKKR